MKAASIAVSKKDLVTIYPVNADIIFASAVVELKKIISK
jgi:hypothetical protein